MIYGRNLISALTLIITNELILALVNLNLDTLSLEVTHKCFKQTIIISTPVIVGQTNDQQQNLNSFRIFGANLIIKVD